MKLAEPKKIGRRIQSKNFVYKLLINVQSVL